jgi:hypothetical protein
VRANQTRRIALAAFLAVGLMAYALTYRSPRPAQASARFAYHQDRFVATRNVSNSGFLLQTLQRRIGGGNVEVDWYDSSLASVTPKTGTYVTLYIDGQQVVSALSGSYFGSVSRGPATLRWAGWLPTGEHRFQVELSRVDGSTDAPYVRLGGVGVDNLVITQEPGGG